MNQLIQVYLVETCWMVSFGNYNVFGPMAGNTYPMPFTQQAPFEMVKADLMRRFPGATVEQVQL